MGPEPTKRKTIIFYGIPAYGHIHSNLYFTGRLSRLGFQVIYYSLEPFREEIEANGCEFRAYPLEQQTVDLSDGKKLLRLYRVLLEYTRDLLPLLLPQAREIMPCCVIFDSLALWGRAISRLLPAASFSFYSIAAVDRIGGKAFMDYASGFSMDFLWYAAELPQAVRIRRQLGIQYGIRDLGMLPVLMNKGDHNLMGYSEIFQPGGSGFGGGYTFLGPVSVHRAPGKPNDFICPEGTVIYISLGTIFNHDERLMREVISQFGSGEGRLCHVVMVWDAKQYGDQMRDVRTDLERLQNFTVRPFVNQSEIMRQADLFITAGGMNSIHEALYYGVPCLLCPQQGEQRLNAVRFEKLGFGRILRDPPALYREAEKAMQLKYSWRDDIRRRMIQVHMEETLGLFRKFLAT